MLPPSCGCVRTCLRACAACALACAQAWVCLSACAWMRACAWVRLGVRVCIFRNCFFCLAVVFVILATFRALAWPASIEIIRPAMCCCHLGGHAYLVGSDTFNGFDGLAAKSPADTVRFLSPISNLFLGWWANMFAMLRLRRNTRKRQVGLSNLMSSSAIFHHAVSPRLAYEGFWVMQLVGKLVATCQHCWWALQC